VPQAPPAGNDIANADILAANLVASHRRWEALMLFRQGRKQQPVDLVGYGFWLTVLIVITGWFWYLIFVY
jgi:hypothetical protein